jgi:small subunit ribosomal protein S21
MSYYNNKPKQPEYRGCTVVVTNDNVDKALRKFKKKIQESGLLIELREREFYTKPTTARKAAKNQARRRWQKKLAADSLPKKMY